MPQRMAGYIGRAIEQHGLPVFSSVIYLRPDAGRRDPGYYSQEHPGHRIMIEYKVLRLSELDGRPILAAGPSGLLPLAPLMQPPAGQTGEAWLRQCVQAVLARPMAKSARGNLVGGLSVLSGLVYAPEIITAILFKEGIMDLIRESSFAQYLTQQAREEGIERGGRERAIEDLLDVLEIRFALGAADPLARSHTGHRGFAASQAVASSGGPSRKSGGIPVPPRRRRVGPSRNRGQARLSCSAR